MKKKNLKTLKLNKESISCFQAHKVLGGIDKTQTCPVRTCPRPNTY